AGTGPSLLPVWQNLWLDPYSRTPGTNREYPLGQLLISLVSEIEKEARKYGKDWRLEEPGRQCLIDISTDLCNFLTEAGNAVIAHVPTVTFMYGDQPVQLKSTGQLLLNYAIAIADKAQTLCTPQHPVHYNFRIKTRQILFSAADVFETAARALLNPRNPFDLPALDLEQENAEVAEVATPSPPVPTSVDIANERVVIPSDQAGNKSGNEGDENIGGDANAPNPPSQNLSFAENIQGGKGKRKNSTAGKVDPPSISSSTDSNNENVTGKRAKHPNQFVQNGGTTTLKANAPRPPPPKSAKHGAGTATPGKTVRLQERVSQTSTTDRRRSLRNRGGDN
ncbi:hypothetical protein Ocin01_15464, partial [Orchesella cincta]